MLQSLKIQNYALIDSLYVEWDGHFNVITGETGAGKSILLGALSLVLGNRADLKSLKKKDSKCLVEACFDISDYKLEQFFQSNDLDYHKISYLRREITSGGRSRSFINDTPVTLQALKSLAEQLVHLHTQHATLELMSKDFAVLSIDRYGTIDSEHYSSLFREWTENKRLLESLKETAKQKLSEQDYLQFLLNELEEAELENVEQESMEQEMNSIENAEEIKQKSSEALNLLQDQEGNIIDQLNHVRAIVNELLRFNKDFGDIDSRINSLHIELQDVSRELESLGEGVTFDPGRLQSIQDQLDKLYRLQKKHQLNSVQELIDKRDEIFEDLSSIEVSSGRIEELESTISKQKTELEQLAIKLSEKRNKTSQPFEMNIEKLLALLGMPHARFKISIATTEELNMYGRDKVRFLFNANKGQELQEVSAVASGGELSRLMLSIKSSLADKMVLPTLIFDEIDTGISGEIAIKMGDLLKSLSKKHQLICITHLPQIAGKADTHYFIYKEIKDEQSATSLKKLGKEERVEILAEMIGGSKAGKVSKAQAEKLLN